jgi:hypothetical protein
MRIVRVRVPGPKTQRSVLVTPMPMNCSYLGDPDPLLRNQALTE